MPGGLLTIDDYGAENLILTGNQKTTFFKATNKKENNYGITRDRLDY